MAWTVACRVGVWLTVEGFVEDVRSVVVPSTLELTTWLSAETVELPAKVPSPP